jgi:hypothetical protein
MHRIDSNGNASNLFTEGNAALSIPATIVSAAIMNALQEEVVKVVLESGQTLLTSATDTRDQLFAGIIELIKRGGVKVTQAIANNQTIAADVTNFPIINRTEVKAFEFLFTIERSTVSGNVVETGRAVCTYNSITAAWTPVVVTSLHDDADVDFIITLVSGNNFKLQYTSSNLTGGSYAGQCLITDIKLIKN